MRMTLRAIPGTIVALRASYGHGSGIPGDERMLQSPLKNAFTCFQ
jgi:hypothetical protein